jgi:glycosyltransferase involved in cell wall biosynthesis
LTAAAAPLLLHVFATFAVGGQQVRFAAIANHFGRAWRHAIVAMDGNTACRERLHPDLDVTFPVVDIRKGDTPGNVRRFSRALRALRPDVLVTCNWGSIEWAMANAMVQRRHVHLEDGFGPEERNRQLSRRAWTRWLFLRRANVVLPSHTLRRIATDIWRLPARHLRYIPNGIDLTRFAAGRPSGPPPWPAQEAGEGAVIGTVAALRPEKNLGRLLRAFALLRRHRPAPPRGLRLVIIGDGPERSALHDLARALDLADAVRFVGHMAEPQHAYRHFDVFALSSDTEQMPLSILEAMASGLPVAATDVGDVAAMLAAGNRRFVVARDDTALAGALASLLDAPALRHELGAANRARAAREYDQETMFRAYAGLLGNPA